MKSLMCTILENSLQICKYSIKGKKRLDLRGHQLIGADEFLYIYFYVKILLKYFKI
jgi:hypothetical protein